MRVGKISRNNTSFTGLLNSKVVLKGLEKISDHGTSFAAGTSLALSLTVRPLAIWSTPDTEKENKQYAISNSICSGLVKFGMVEAVALPLENAVKKIDENPARVLNSQTIRSLKGTSGRLVESGAYKFATQLVKLGGGVITAIPKSVLTVAFIPIIMDKIFNIKKPDKLATKQKTSLNKEPNKNVAFGANLTDNISRKIGKLFENKYFQNFVKKHEHDEKNIAKHITALTDILLTGTSAFMTSKSKDIKENRKKALIYNNIISTAITLGFGYGIDNIIKGKTNKFIENFAKINKGDPKLHKYIEGINILRPALIFAGIYYGVLPIFSTYIAEKVDNYIKKQDNETKVK